MYALVYFEVEMRDKLNATEMGLNETVLIKVSVVDTFEDST